MLRCLNLVCFIVRSRNKPPPNWLLEMLAIFSDESDFNDMLSVKSFVILHTLKHYHLALRALPKVHFRSTARLSNATLV